MTGSSYTDTANLTQAVPYYYVVRAVETSSTATIEDTNTVQKSAAATGAITPAREPWL